VILVYSTNTRTTILNMPHKPNNRANFTRTITALAFAAIAMLALPTQTPFADDQNGTPGALRITPEELGIDPDSPLEVPEKFRSLFERPTPEEAKAAKERRSREALIYNLLQAAFVDTLWLENSLVPEISLEPFKNYLRSRERKREYDNWLLTFSARENGLPEHDRLVKWTEPAAVSLGWPHYGISNVPTISAETQQLFEGAARRAIEEIERALPGRLKYVDPGERVESTPDYAKIRIVPVTASVMSDDYNVVNHDPHIVSSHNWYYDINKLYVGAIPFTPDDGTNVDGFLLPKRDNSLGLSVCRISESLPRDEIAALVVECVARSMGLPGLVAAATNSILGPSGGERPMRLAETDIAMLRLLYCEEVEPGFSKYEVILKLVEVKACTGTNDN